MGIGIIFIWRYGERFALVVWLTCSNFCTVPSRFEMFLPLTAGSDLSELLVSLLIFRKVCNKSLFLNPSKSKIGYTQLRPIHSGSTLSAQRIQLPPWHTHSSWFNSFDYISSYSFSCFIAKIAECFKQMSIVCLTFLDAFGAVYGEQLAKFMLLEVSESYQVISIQAWNAVMIIKGQNQTV